MVTVVLEEYSKEWPARFEHERRDIVAALGGRAVAIEHVGSTSVPTLKAKPVIDIALVVPDTTDEDAYVPALVTIGYEFLMREPDWFEHRLLRRDDPRVNLHVFPPACDEVDRMIAFREHLRADAADRAHYQSAKEVLAQSEWPTMQHYADAKTGVIAEIVGRARRDARMHVVVETERLILRRFTTDDIDNLVELDGDPDVMLHVTGGRITPRDEIETDFLPAFLGYYERSDGYGFWAVVEKSTGDFLGWFHFRPGEGHPDEEPELGYRLRKSAWGKGYATEGSIALIDRGFTDLGVRRVIAETMVAHTGSRRVMEKAGMRVVRTFEQDWPYPIPGDEHGDVEYAITREEWEEQRR
ncbi:MAG TPA: bifunctional GrpB family protein/GNAT family N-acetyltransferase [Ilumatobacteraceae bacterium]|nr:bifunctional GrpB family protein/GNAT family N-acetyltransferase [Ilumatobacteraceae bacterium]